MLGKVVVAVQAFILHLANYLKGHFVEVNAILLGALGLSQMMATALDDED